MLYPTRINHKYERILPGVTKNFVRSGTHTIGEQSVPKLAEITGIGFRDLLYTLKQNIHEYSNVTCNS